jgi:hypothetical protein
MMGSRFGSARNLRLAAIFALLVVAMIFHNVGGNSTAARTYRIAVFGVLALGIALSGSRRGISIGQAPVGPTRNPSEPPAAAGWYAVSGQMGVQRYWDGAAWGQRRRWDGSKWVPD